MNMKRSTLYLIGTLVISLLACGALSGCKKKSANPFPASGTVAGWEKSSETRTFAPKDLWQYIDGDSEQFIQAGVVSTATSDYKYQGQLEAVVDVYTMGGPDGAQTILERGQTKEAQSAQVGDEGLQYAQSVSFRKGPYLVRIVAYQSSASAPQALMALAHGVEANL
ncbi:hypothetical protein P8935_23930 [Telmatobacter sp. DSM 110680]|uniref:Uncharacterized protein n=1 Tax=Telmatobacter sp. DSM 110680 TaxID=3036704 RepID=A0AAU7DJS5_9BACT